MNYESAMRAALERARFGATASGDVPVGESVLLVPVVTEQIERSALLHRLRMEVPGAHGQAGQEPYAQIERV